MFTINRILNLEVIMKKKCKTCRHFEKFNPNANKGVCKATRRIKKDSDGITCWTYAKRGIT